MKELAVRNGENADGWAVRLYGDHSANGFNGSIHNSVWESFFNSWEPNDKIGILYNPLKKELSYFQNGKFLGTPFKNVEGDLYVCLEVCHIGTFNIVQNPQLPLSDTI